MRERVVRDAKRLTWKEMDAGWMPIAESWRCSQNAMGFEISMDMLGEARCSRKEERTSSNPSQI